MQKMEDDNDNFDIENDEMNDEMLRILETSENQYRSTQLPQDVPMPTIKHDPPDEPMPSIKQEVHMNLIEDTEEPNVPNLATNSGFGYHPYGMQQIEEDFQFDLQRQGYSERAYDNSTTELINARKELKIQSHTIDVLKLELERYKSRARREDTPMRDTLDTKTHVDLKIFPSTDSFSVKRVNHESRSTHSRLNRPIKKGMSSFNKVIPAPVMPKQLSLISSQRSDVSMQSPITPSTTTIDHNEIDRQNKLLAILLCDSFPKWRKNTSVQISVDLTQTQLNELCHLEANMLLPINTCSPDSLKRLKLVHNDYIGILLNYKSSGLLQRLLTLFRLSLTFALKENQHAIVIYIVSKIGTLTMTFPDAIDILYNEFIRMDTTSTLFFIAKALNLFYTDINPEIPENLKQHLPPDLTRLNLSELTNITDDYSTSPDIILKMARERIKPEAAINGTQSILEIILAVSKRVKQPLFIWLLNDVSFTTLLSKNMPDTIIYNALSVIETYTKESFETAFINDQEISAVKKLLDMMQSPPLDMPQDKVFFLQERITKNLQIIITSSLSPGVFKCLYQEIVPVLISQFRNKIDELSLHGHPRLTKFNERSIVSCVYLLALLSPYSFQDEKYPPHILADDVEKMGYTIDNHRPLISERAARQIKDQISYINTQLNNNVIMIE